MVSFQDTPDKAIEADKANEVCSTGAHCSKWRIQRDFYPFFPFIYYRLQNN